MAKKKPGEGFATALASLAVGQTFKDGAYQLDSVDEARSRFLFSRVATGSPVVVTASLLDRVWSATDAGGTLAYRKNGPSGISYTIATQLLVVEALGLTRDEEGRWARKDQA